MSEKLCPICEDKNCGYKESELYWHEALDRSYVAADHFYEHVHQHPAVLHDVELEAVATNILVAVQDFYQLVGSKAHAFDLLAQSKNEDGLLPCPFCEGEPDFKYHRPNPEEGTEFVSVVCRACGTQTCVCEYVRQAEAAWNRRRKS